MANHPTPIDLYSGLMTEVKVRMRAIDQVTGGDTRVIGAPIVQEFCFLQLRMICELIALGCLVAHGDISTSKMEKEYAADRILNQLSILHADFYPMPARRIGDTPDGGPHIEAVYNNGCLAQAELPALYARCGEMLHRGSVKRILKNQMPQQFHFPEIQKWTRKITALLDLHMIVLHDFERAILCAMNPDTHAVQVLFLTAK